MEEKKCNVIWVKIRNIEIIDKKNVYNKLIIINSRILRINKCYLFMFQRYYKLTESKICDRPILVDTDQQLKWLFAVMMISYLDS